MKSVWVAVAGASLLEIDTWILQTSWLAWLGAALIIYSIALLAREAN